MNKRELYEKMISIYPKEKVNFIMYNLFQYIYPEIEEKEKRKDQQSFRNDLIERYNGCIITGVSDIVCDACHIIPHSECDNKDKYNVDNGLLMRSDLHILFDKGLLKINPHTSEILLNDTLLSNQQMEQYFDLHNKKIYIHKNSIHFLQKIY